MTPATTKLSKQELAQMLARALNLLNDVRDDEWNNRQTNEFHALACMLSDEARQDFMENATLDARHLGMKTK